MKNTLLSNAKRKKRITAVSLLLFLIMISSLNIGCNSTKSEDEVKKVDLLDSTVEKTYETKEENIEAYNESKGYQIAMNSGIGFDIYVPQKDRENNQEFFNNLNEKSMLNGYDFSSYLDKPLTYVAMAIESNDIHEEEISFLCYKEKIVGVWIDPCNKEKNRTVTGTLAQYNFVYDNAEELLNYKSPYVGDNSNVLYLMYSLAWVNGVKPISVDLQTDNQPYGITCNCQGYGADTILSLPYFKNAAVIFSLIDNVGTVTFNVEDSDGNTAFKFTREEIEDYFETDVRKHTENQTKFKEFLKEVLDSNLP